MYNVVLCGSLAPSFGCPAHPFNHKKGTVQIAKCKTSADYYKFGVYQHSHTQQKKKRHSKLEVLLQGPVNPSEAEVCHGTGQNQSPWTWGVGRFHGTLDINAPPLLEVNNSAHSITCTRMCACTHTYALCTAIITLTFTFRD